jgi:hypothetical protein
MAKLNPPLNFTGSLGNLSAYRMRGHDQIILRTKGGATREKIRTSPNFELVRRNNSEFSGRAVMSKWIMKALRPLKALADYNIAGPLNALVKPIQALDTQSVWGKRHVQLTKQKSLLEGFSLNRKNQFDAVLRASVSFSVSREECTANLTIPALVPGINFFPPLHQTVYSMVAVLGIVPDVFYSDGKYLPSSPSYSDMFITMATTLWKPVSYASDEVSLQLTGNFEPPDEYYSVMLSIGIRYGELRNGNDIVQKKYAGSAKILKLV